MLAREYVFGIRKFSYYASFRMYFMSSMIYFLFLYIIEIYPSIMHSIVKIGVIDMFVLDFIIPLVFLFAMNDTKRRFWNLGKLQFLNV